MSIQQNVALFSLLGTQYGGDGQTTFALPNLQGRVPVHAGTNSFSYTYVQGELGGAETVTLTPSTLPAHSHGVNCVGSGGTQASPVGAYPAVESTGTSMDYSTATGTGQMNPGTIATAGSGAPFSIEQPYLVMNFIIALQGIFPSRG